MTIYKDCPKCGKSHTKNGKFCSRSCANSRGPRSEETKAKTSRSVRAALDQQAICKVVFVECNHCNNFFVRSRARSGHHHGQLHCGCQNKCSRCGTSIVRSVGGTRYCNTCISSIKHYRHKAKFKFNVYDFPDEFELDLLEHNGWYCTAGMIHKPPNPNGVSRDHIYSVSDGFANKIDPEIVAHPANCRLMLHNGPAGNNAKKGNSSITIDELLNRIEWWNVKYRTYR